MQDFLLNIDNKEILIEILHHSIDYLIGNSDETQLARNYSKYGFHSSDDFIYVYKTIARCYRNYCTEGGTEAELLSEFVNLNPELQRLVPTVLAARRPEVMKFLLRKHNAQDLLIESFDWDLRLIMGDSSCAQNYRQVVTVTLNCRESSGRAKPLHIEMDRTGLEKFISTLELAVKDSEITDKQDVTDADKINDKNSDK